MDHQSIHLLAFSFFFSIHLCSPNYCINNYNIIRHLKMLLPVPLILILIIQFCTIAKLANAKEKVVIESEESNSILDNEKELNVAEDDEQKDLSNGFGTDIDWVSWPDEAISIALDLNKPIMLLIHKTWCGACTALKRSFNTSNKRTELVELSKNFVMVNLEDDDEPEDDIYAPDGRYIPRLFILDKRGKPLAVDNRKNYPNNHQYFPQVPDVIRAMKQGLEIFGGKKQQKEEPKRPMQTKAEESNEEESARPRKDDEWQQEKRITGGGGGGGCPHAKAAKKAKEEETIRNNKKNNGKIIDEVKKETTGKSTMTLEEKSKPEKKTKEMEKQKVKDEQKKGKKQKEIKEEL